MSGNVDERSDPSEPDHTRLTSGADRCRWPPFALEPLGRLAIAKANSVLSDEHEAKDIAQVALAALVARPDPPPNPEAWVTTRAGWLALNELRRRRREEDKIGRLGQQGVPPSEDFTDRVAARLLVDDILAELSPQQRRAVELQCLLDDPPATAAKVMKITKQTLKKHRQRALAKARQYGRLVGEWEDQ